MLVICDIDGTLADCTHREHKLPDWDAFFEDMHLDTPDPHTLWMLKTILLFDCSRLAFMTGRSERYRVITQEWLSNKCGLDFNDDYEALLMRPEDDYSPDIDLKRWLLEKYVKDLTRTSLKDPVVLNPRNNILLLEDRDKVVVGMRNAGWTVWQVKEGTY